MYYRPDFRPAILNLDLTTPKAEPDLTITSLTVSLRDPKSTCASSSFNAAVNPGLRSADHLLARHRWDSLSSAVPGLMDDPAMYVGYTMTVLPFPELTP